MKSLNTFELFNHAIKMKYISKYEGIAIGINDKGEFIAVGTGLHSQTMRGLKQSIDEYSVKDKPATKILVSNWTSTFNEETVKLVKTSDGDNGEYDSVRVFFCDQKRQHLITLYKKASKFNEYFEDSKKNAQLIQAINKELEAIAKIRKERDTVVESYDKKVETHKNKISTIKQQMTPLKVSMLEGNAK